MVARHSRLIAAVLLVSALCLSAGVAGAQGQNATPRNRVVIQVSDAEPAKWNLALNNAGNIQTDLGAANVDVEIVAYGPGIGMLKADSVVGNRIGEAGKAGVKVVACENTMHAQKLTQVDMLSGIGYVPAGVVELMQRQQQGWAYIRP
jgi:intracellular sulfur oxidation DsrE/DsrF family protein